MRVIGPVLVVLLLLASGGIVVRAESAGPLSVEETPTPAQDICSERVLPAVREIIVPRNPVAAALSDARQVIDLNTRGYNYKRPGDVWPEPPPLPASPAPDER